VPSKEDEKRLPHGELSELVRKRQEATETLRRNGVRLFIIEKLKNTSIYRRVILSELDLDKPISNFTAKIPITIDLLKSNEVDELAAFCSRVRNPSLTASETRNRLTAGHLCSVARHHGQIIHFSWAAIDSFHIGELGLRIRLAPGQVCGYDMYTAPEFRNLGVARARMAWTLKYLQKAGYRRLIAWALPENEPSRRAGRNVGVWTDGWLARITLGPIAFTLYRPMRNEPAAEDGIDHA
jgi:GNAT superfamily N-acetyltransferase